LIHSVSSHIRYASVVASRSCVVSFTANGSEWSNVTAGTSVFDAVRNAERFFQSSFWRGPLPTLDTIYKVALVGDDRVWRVRARSVAGS
jgi:hypothetical protein